jgi:hypothetical protein
LLDNSNPEKVAGLIAGLPEAVLSELRALDPSTRDLGEGLCTAGEHTFPTTNDPVCGWQVRRTRSCIAKLTAIKAFDVSACQLDMNFGRTNASKGDVVEMDFAPMAALH